MAHSSTPAATLPTAVNALLTELGCAGSFSTSVVTSMVGEGAAVLVKRALERGRPRPRHAARARTVPRALRRTAARQHAAVPGDARDARPPSRRGIVSPSSRTSRAARRGNPEGPRDRPPLQRRHRRRLGARPQARIPPAFSTSSARAGVTPRETLLVGDSPVDLETSRRAGTRICLARYGFGYRFEGTASAGTNTSSTSPPNCRRSSARLGDDNVTGAARSLSRAATAEDSR